MVKMKAPLGAGKEAQFEGECVTLDEEGCIVLNSMRAVEAAKSHGFVEVPMGEKRERLEQELADSLERLPEAIKAGQFKDSAYVTDQMAAHFGALFTPEIKADIETLFKEHARAKAKADADAEVAKAKEKQEALEKEQREADEKAKAAAEKKEEKKEAEPEEKGKTKKLNKR